jgi:hypothetical protein
LKLASDRNHLGGNFWVGNWTFQGIETRQDKIIGKQLMEEIFKSGDRFWTFAYAYYVERGLRGFQGNHNEIYANARSQPISDSSIFKPVGFPNWELKVNC